MESQQEKDIKVDGQFHIKTQIPFEYLRQEQLPVEYKKCKKQTLKNFTLINPQKSQSCKQSRAFARGCENLLEYSAFKQQFLYLLAELSNQKSDLHKQLSLANDLSKQKKEKISKNLESILNQYRNTDQFAIQLLNLYTRESEFYKIMNTILRMPPNKKLKECYKMICSYLYCTIQLKSSLKECMQKSKQLNDSQQRKLLFQRYEKYYKQQKEKGSLLCFRKTRMEVEQAIQMKNNMNKLYEPLSFLSTTLDITKIDDFNDNALIIIEIPKQTAQRPQLENHGFVYLGGISWKLSEEEVLFNILNNFMVLDVTILDELNFDGINIIIKLRYGVLRKVQDGCFDHLNGKKDKNCELAEYYLDLQKQYAPIWGKNMENLQDRKEVVQLTSLNWEFFTPSQIKQHQAKSFQELIQKNLLSQLKQFLKWLIKREVYFQNNFMDSLNQKVYWKPKYSGDFVKQRLKDFEEFRLYRDNFIDRYFIFSKNCDLSKLKPDGKNDNADLKEILKLAFFYYENAYYFYLEIKSIEAAQSALKNFENKVQTFMFAVPKELKDKMQKLKFKIQKMIEKKQQKFNKLSQKQKKQFTKKQNEKIPNQREIAYFYSFIQTEQFLKKFRKHEREEIKEAEKYFQYEFHSFQRIEETAAKYENKQFMFLILLRKMEHHIYKCQTQSREGFITGVKKYHQRIFDQSNKLDVKPPNYVIKMADYWLMRAHLEIVSAYQNQNKIHVHQTA